MVKLAFNKYRSVLALGLLFWLAVGLFTKIGVEILEGEPIKFDRVIQNFIHARATPSWDHLFLNLTRLGNIQIALPVTLIIILFYVYKSEKKHALIIAASVAGAVVANSALKLLFHRTRPALWHTIITEKSYSFPSGHALVSSALISAIILICWNKSYRFVVLGVGVLLIGLIGLSRVYLGVHYPSDIIGGWIIGSAWSVITYLSVNRFSNISRPTKSSG